MESKRRLHNIQKLPREIPIMYMEGGTKQVPSGWAETSLGLVKLHGSWVECQLHVCAKPRSQTQRVSVLKREPDGSASAGQFFVSKTSKPQGKIWIKVSFWWSPQLLRKQRYDQGSSDLLEQTSVIILFHESPSNTQAKTKSIHLTYTSSDLCSVGLTRSGKPQNFKGSAQWK